MCHYMQHTFEPELTLRHLTWQKKREIDVYKQIIFSLHNSTLCELFLECNHCLNWGISLKRLGNMINFSQHTLQLFELLDVLLSCWRCRCSCPCACHEGMWKSGGRVAISTLTLDGDELSTAFHNHLTPRKDPQAAIECESGWTPEVVSVFWRRDKSVLPAKNWSQVICPIS
jgi:hypothetical protein